MEMECRMHMEREQLDRVRGQRQREVRFPVEISGRENGPAAAAQRVNQWGDDRRTNRAGGNEMNEGRKESRGSIQ